MGLRASVSSLTTPLCRVGSATVRSLRSMRAPPPPPIAPSATGLGGGVNRGMPLSTARELNSIVLITATACSWADRACSLLARTSCTAAAKPASPPLAKPIARVALTSNSTGSGMVILAAATIRPWSLTARPMASAVCPAEPFQSINWRMASLAASAASPCQPDSVAASFSDITRVASAISVPMLVHSEASCPICPGSLFMCTALYRSRCDIDAQFWVVVSTRSESGAGPFS